MSWLARSLANSLRLDDENDVVSRPSSQLSFGDPSPSSPTKPQQPDDHGAEPESEDEAQTRGVKEDLSELGQVLTRQLWGVASFLAPPPSDLPQSAWDRQPEPSDRPDPAPEMAWEEREGEEEEEEERESFVGVTDEVLAFARNIAMHPETWLDFPLDEEEDLDGNLSIYLYVYCFLYIDLWNCVFPLALRAKSLIWIMDNLEFFFCFSGFD